ncbi:MAG: potassium transporter TrkG, partial [Bacteroidales bacterium]
INILMLLFIFIYILIFLVGAMIMAITGIPVNEAVGASVSAMSNVGPGLGASGNMGNYSAFNDVAVVTMTLEMLIGRLEIFTVIALFTRSFWRN